MKRFAQTPTSARRIAELLQRLEAAGMKPVYEETISISHIWFFLGTEYLTVEEAESCASDVEGWACRRFHVTPETFRFLKNWDGRCTGQTRSGRRCLILVASPYGGRPLGGPFIVGKTDRCHCHKPAEDPRFAGLTSVAEVRARALELGLVSQPEFCLRMGWTAASVEAGVAKRVIPSPDASAQGERFWTTESVELLAKMLGKS